MRGRILTLCAAVCMSLATVGGFSGSATAQDGMPAIGAPAEIKALAGMDGTYDVTVKMKMAPDAPWTESQAKATVEMVLDGCAQKMSFQGEMMGMEFHTRATTYDMGADGFKWKMEQSMDGGKTYAEAMHMEYKRAH